MPRACSLTSSRPHRVQRNLQAETSSTRPSSSAVLRAVGVATVLCGTSPAVASCVDSYLDTEGVLHTVDGEAGSCMKRPARAIRTFWQHDCAPGNVSNSEV